MTEFADLGLSSNALKAVKKLKYTEPTPVQERAIPLVLEGYDIIAAASTGTGKTAAFLLPILSTLPKGKRGKRAPRVLIVSPTRELTQQIFKTCLTITKMTGHFSTVVYGGSAYGPQIDELRRGTDVLIATPGRLMDLMNKGHVDLSKIDVLVLDEADRMLDMGFLPDVTTIVNATPEDRQTLLFSATIDESIERNLGSLLHNPKMIEVSKRGETAKTVAQYVLPIEHHRKGELLRALLTERDAERVIVFARTKMRAEEFATMLNEHGFKADSIHSDKSQGARRRALGSFRRGTCKVLVATDVLARGIDVPQVDYVVNLDLPDIVEDYVHRIGRTGRAGEDGVAISFCTRQSRTLLRQIEKLIGKDIPIMQLESFQTDPTLLEDGTGTAGGKRSRKKGEHSWRKKKGTSSQKRREVCGDSRIGRKESADKKGTRRRKNTGVTTGKRTTDTTHSSTARRAVRR
ncbi:DEAD/DEAH box helicase [Adlercreutzia sp. ZJ141]|uniref:DEAD/DEAH box helicase n=1 Tax=Adlercreutzia sp. ZJ141 TaxID=2709406 RepID=UPI0013EBF5EB|nr:DEAD/DEAH box helicase [Adlercreutzia sp. ZJ141]